MSTVAEARDAGINGQAVLPVTLEMDMREIPLLKRLDAILAAWKKLAAGQSLRLVNDRAPTPLEVMFRATENGRHQWSYEKQGPTVWVARNTRL